MATKNIRIILGLNGVGKIYLGGIEVSRLVRDISFSSTVGSRPKLSLEIIAEKYQIEADADVVGMLSSVLEEEIQ